LVLGACVAGWRLSLVRHADLQTVRERFIMGTSCRMIAVGPPAAADDALDDAWKELEAVAATMSTYDPNSQLSRWNAADAEADVPLPPSILAVLRRAQQASLETQGAFDVTVLPLVKLWSQGARQNREPQLAELENALQRVGSTKFAVGHSSARKNVAGLQVTLDGIAPGYAVHQALAVLQRAGLSGGLIDLGGDIACFGRPADADAWHIAVQDPWSDGDVGVIRLRPETGTIAAVSTSGDYRRFLEIGGRRYSHILDPRTGRPAVRATSVTVIADDAVNADVWATALSVLGPEEGLPLIESNPALQALFIIGTRAEPRHVATQGFPPLAPH
jgi:thiamine biosynthesis lipoprotein